MLDRLSSLRTKLRTLNLDALLIHFLPNQRYLTGFSGSNGVTLITQDHFVLITDNRYREQVKQEVEKADTCIALKNILDPIKKNNLLKGCDRIGFEADHMPFSSFSRLKNLFPDKKLVATENIIEKLTVVKTEKEIDDIRHAAQIAVNVWDAVLPLICAGATELDLAAELSYQAKRKGAEGDAFDAIVASGERSALPHGSPTTKTVQHGELIVFDFGFKVNGFCSDITRTVSLGEPSPIQKRVYEAVKEAHALAVASVEPDMMAADLDAIARDKLAALGFDEEFSHSLGHGLGLDVHSFPRIGKNSKDKIPTGSVITIEPGVYLPGQCGVRIEDDILIGPEKGEILTPLSRELIVID